MNKWFKLKNRNGLEVEFCNIGGRIYSIKLPVKHDLIDIIVGPSDKDRYLLQDNYLGAICGRYANRIANGAFSIHNKTYQLSKNEDVNHIHGGFIGFNSVVWDIKSIKSIGYESSFLLSYLSKDGVEGYPGNCLVNVTYALTDDDEFHIHFTATTDKPTIINLSSHPYFNLKGKGTVLDHYLFINAKYYTPAKPDHIPTGEIEHVENAGFDFRIPKLISKTLAQNHQYGLDHNFVLERNTDELIEAASLYHQESGRSLSIYTTQPGIQIYTAQHFNEKMIGKNGFPLIAGDGVALEPQNFPDAPNHVNFPTAVLFPGKIYDHKIVYKFMY